MALDIFMDMQQKLYINVKVNDKVPDTYANVLSFPPGLQN